MGKDPGYRFRGSGLSFPSLTMAFMGSGITSAMDSANIGWVPAMCQALSWLLGGHSGVRAKPYPPGLTFQQKALLGDFLKEPGAWWSRPTMLDQYFGLDGFQNSEIW